MIETEILRHNPLIDPTLHVWGWEIAVYLFLGGIAAGTMVLAGGTKALHSRMARLLIFVAPLALSLGMLALFIDLEHKQHVFRFYTAFRITSPMSWGSWLLLFIYPATLLMGLAQLEVGGMAGRVATFARANELLLRRLNVVLGVALGAYTGILLGTLTARPAWSSLLLAPLFLASGISAAAAVGMLLPVGETDRALMRRWDVVAMAAEAGVLALFFLELVSAGGARGRAAASLFFGGPFTAVFWSLVVIAGLAVPLTLELFEARRRMHIVLAPALVLIGGLSLRWILVLAGQFPT
ncbi:MAG: NrfD/PsrC family molybdoenzyme membrane anchor subunit [Acidobacteriota bacterium]